MIGISSSSNNYQHQNHSIQSPDLNRSCQKLHNDDERLRPSLGPPRSPSRSGSLRTLLGRSGSSDSGSGSLRALLGGGTSSGTGTGTGNRDASPRQPRRRHSSFKLSPKLGSSGCSGSMLQPKVTVSCRKLSMAIDNTHPVKPDRSPVSGGCEKNETHSPTKKKWRRKSVKWDEGVRAAPTKTSSGSCRRLPKSSSSGCCDDSPSRRRQVAVQYLLKKIGEQAAQQEATEAQIRSDREWVRARVESGGYIGIVISLNRLRKHEADLQRGSTTLRKLSKLLCDAQKLSSSSSSSAAKSCDIKDVDSILDEAKFSEPFAPPYSVQEVDANAKEDILREARRVAASGDSEESGVSSTTRATI